MNASEQIDNQIAGFQDWRGERLTAFRELVRETEPDMVEEFKWGTAVWTYNKKLVCAASAFKDHVKYNFFKGAYLTSQAHVFNSGQDSKEHRSINLVEQDAFDAKTLAGLITAAVDYAKSQ